MNPYAVSDELADTSRWLRDTLLDSLDLRRLTPKELRGPRAAHARRDHARPPRRRARAPIAPSLAAPAPAQAHPRRGARPRPARGLPADADRHRDHGRRPRHHLRRATRPHRAHRRALHRRRRVRAVIERIVTPLGRRIDESSPLVDARLQGRLARQRHHPPARAARLVHHHPQVLAHAAHASTTSSRFGSLDRAHGALPRARASSRKKNIVISGGTGIGQDDAAQRALAAPSPTTSASSPSRTPPSSSSTQPHVVSLETRPAEHGGQGRVHHPRSREERAAHAARPHRRRRVPRRRGARHAPGDEHRPRRLAHDDPRQLARRGDRAPRDAGADGAASSCPSRAIREQIAGSVHLIVQQARFSDGSRKVTAITEVIGIDDDGDDRARARSSSSIARRASAAA